MCNAHVTNLGSHAWLVPVFNVIAYGERMAVADRNEQGTDLWIG